MKVKDISGQVFGRLVVKSFYGLNKYQQALWKCRCDCGKIVIKPAAELKRGTKSCGCYRGEYVRQIKTTHGVSGNPTYNAWHTMIQRCFNPENKRYHRYGGRGITVCDLLKSSPVNLILTIGYRPKEGLTLDRINNNGNYSCGKCAECLQKSWPLNIRWATYAQQNRNTSRSVMITYNGKTQCKQDWCKELGIPHSTLDKRFHKGYDIGKSRPPAQRRIEINGKRQSIAAWVRELNIPYGTFYGRLVHGQIPDAKEVKDGI